MQKRFFLHIMSKKASSLTDLSNMLKVVNLIRIERKPSVKMKGSYSYKYWYKSVGKLRNGCQVCEIRFKTVISKEPEVQNVFYSNLK